MLGLSRAQHEKSTLGVPDPAAHYSYLFRTLIWIEAWWEGTSREKPRRGLAGSEFAGVGSNRNKNMNSNIPDSEKRQAGKILV
jgi:hypothetical protein